MVTQSAVTYPLLSMDRLTFLCEALLRADPDIRDIVVFGLAAYAPDLARDIDLLVITTFRKDDDVYFDATAGWPTDVDILVKEPGETVGKDMSSTTGGTSLNSSFMISKVPVPLLHELLILMRRKVAST